MPDVLRNSGLVFEHDILLFFLGDTFIVRSKPEYFLKKYDWVLKCDIKRFFPSIDHIILKQLYRKKIKDKDALWLIDAIIDNSNEQEFVCEYYSGDTLLTPLERRKGLPIGNLTSQWFGNFYLNNLDHFIKEELHCKPYVRYVDDFVLFSNSKQKLHQWKSNIINFLETLRLRLNIRQVHIYPTTCGRNFLGQVVYKSFRRLPGKNVRLFRNRMNRWKRLPPQNMSQRIAGWTGHAKQADTKGLLKTLFPADSEDQ